MRGLCSTESRAIGGAIAIPGFGLLADQFPAAHLHHWHYDSTGRTPALYGPGGRVPLKPMCGTIGLAPAEAGQHSIVPPRRVGGNMDIRDLAAGIGPDLMAAARDALSDMVELLAAEHAMAPIDAYMLCSVCGDLRISEIVDMPNWVVSFYFPRVVFA